MPRFLDSHPDVLYRHEPDEVVPAGLGIHPRDQLRTWIDVKALRTAAKRPFFRKSWLPAPLGLLRNTLAHTLNGVARLSRDMQARNRLKLPDFVAIDRRPGLRAVIKVVGWDASAIARELSDSRILFILRHPCGVVSSALRGAAQHRFESSANGSEVPYDEAQVMTFATSRGVDAAALQELSAAAKCAWSWVAFNEGALERHYGLQNVRLILYEDLCARPEAVARELMDFVGLAWHPQTEKFIARSTRHNGHDSYYGVFRNAAAAERWRSTMDKTDREAVTAVARHSRLARYWPDLA